MFRAFPRHFGTVSGSQYSSKLQQKFAQTHVTGTTNEALIRGEPSKQVSFCNSSKDYYCSRNETATDKTILPYGIPETPSVTPQTSNGFGMSMWDSSAVSARFNTKWFGIKEGATIPTGFAINQDMLDDVQLIDPKQSVF